jgi:hypothetical protein
MLIRSYSQVPEQLDELFDKATNDRETIIIERQGHPAVNLVTTTNTEHRCSPAPAPTAQFVPTRAIVGAGLVI